MTASETAPARARRQWGKRGSFWAAASVLALCLWASGAPSTLYPSYAAEWDLSPVVTTSIFGTEVCSPRPAACENHDADLD